MRRLLLPLAVLVLALAAPAAVQADPPDLGPAPYKCGDGCHDVDSPDPNDFSGTSVGEVEISPHTVRVGEEMTIDITWAEGWRPNSFHTPGTPVDPCPPPPSDATSWSCTMQMNGATNAWVLVEYFFCCFNAHEEEYYAVIDEGRVISGDVREFDPTDPTRLVPAAGVEVAALVDGRVWRTTTNPAGHYELLTSENAGEGEVGTAGGHCVRADLPRCRTSKEIGSGNETVDFELPARVKIKGRVAEGCPCESDEGVEGVTISAENDEGDVVDSAVSGNTDTTEGYYELFVPPGEVTLSADDEDVCAFVLGDCPPTRTIDAQAETTQDWQKESGCDEPEEEENGRRRLQQRAEEDCPLVVNKTGDQEDQDADDRACDIDTSTTADDCTLRAAIQVANSRSSAQEIKFNIEDAGSPPVIQPRSALPAISQAVTIDGTSQPGTAAGSPGIEVDGTEAGTNVNGLRVSAGNSLIKGLVIVGFRGQGVIFDGAGGSKLQGSWLGVHRGGQGFEPKGNGAGVEIKAANTTIGGGGAARNVIAGSGNLANIEGVINQLRGARDLHPSQLSQLLGALGVGIFLSSTDAQGSVINNNVIGLAPDGTRTGSLADPTGQFGNTMGVLALPINRGHLRGVAIKSNVISGNYIGMLGAIAGISVFQNKIGPGIDGNPVRPGNVGNRIGLLLIGVDDPIEVFENQIQGNAIGLLAGGLRGVNVHNNLIGVNQNLIGFGRDVQAALARNEDPNIGLHNVVGAMIVGVEARFTDNQVLGNPLGVLALGIRNFIADNEIGGPSISPRSVREMRGRDFSGIVGAVLLGNGQRFERNSVSGNIIGLQSMISTASSIEGNAFSTNAISALTFNTRSSNFNRNTITGSVLGLIAVQHEFTPAELQAMGLNQADVTAPQREVLLNAPVVDRETDLASGLAGEQIDGGDVVAEPVAAARARPRQAPNQRQGSVDNDYIGNTIGTVGDGSTRAGNIIGAWLLGGQRDVRFEGNTVAHNTLTGFALGPGIRGDWPANVRLSGNRIYDNHATGAPTHGVGFDLLEVNALTRSASDIFGPSLPDRGDTDDGPNALQNAPVLSGAAPEGRGSVRVVGTLNSAPNTPYSLEFFANGRCGAFGFGEGEEPIGVTPIRTNGDGNAAFSGRLPVAADRDRGITVMATGPDGTSEFSNCQRVAETGVGAAPGPLTPDAQGNVVVTVFCLDAEPCAGRTTLQESPQGNGTRAAAAAKRKKKKAGNSRRLGRKRFNIRPGQRASVKIKLPKRKLRQLKGSRTLRVKAKVRLRDGRRDTVSWTLYPRA